MSGNHGSNNSAAGGGIGFCGLLAIVFIVLKLVGIIKWSWIWVLSPLWIPVTLTILYIIFLAWLMKK